MNSILDRCVEKGLRLTDQRRVIIAVLDAATDHPDAEEVYSRALKADPQISLATVYRTLKLFEEKQIVERLEFGEGRARFEAAAREHHDHLIDIETGDIIEFVDPEIEALQEKIAARLGYRLTGHRMELFGEKIKKPS